LAYTCWQARAERVRAALAAGNELHVTHPNGTDLRLRIQGRTVAASDGIISAEDLKAGPPPAVYLPAGEVYSTVEAPRGELFYYAKGNKTQVLERLKIKAHNFSNVSAMVEAFKGMEYGSVPAIIASYDPCLSCTSR